MVTSVTALPIPRLAGCDVSPARCQPCSAEDGVDHTRQDVQPGVRLEGRAHRRGHEEVPIPAIDVDVDDRVGAMIRGIGDGGRGVGRELRDRTFAPMPVHDGPCLPSASSPTAGPSASGRPGNDGSCHGMVQGQSGHGCAQPAVDGPGCPIDAGRPSGTASGTAWTDGRLRRPLLLASSADARHRLHATMMGMRARHRDGPGATVLQRARPGS